MPMGVYERTENYREIMSKAMKGRIVSEKTKEKISKAWLGKTREKNNSWKGGFLKKNNGYILFNVPKDCRFSCMADKKGYVGVHRLTMAAYLGRPLTSEEVVHHINEIRDDNRIENLMLFKSKGEHRAYHSKLKDNGGIN